MKQDLTLQAPAKINSYLKVLKQRTDGFHNLSSLMHMVGLYDRLTFQEKESGIALHIPNSPLPSDGSNLVIQATELLQQKMDEEGYPKKGVSIILEKEIPLAAGLAGGSSDAAATLIGLNRLWSLFWPKQKLAALGAALGSDVPFFFDGPTAWVSGRGEIVRPIQSDIKGWIVLVHPQIPVSTASTFKAYSERIGLTNQGTALNIRPEERGLSSEDVLRSALNDLELVTFDRFPILKVIKDLLQSLDGQLTLMSGSGPTLFALFGDQEKAEKAARQVEQGIQGISFKLWVIPLLRQTPFEWVF